MTLANTTGSAIEFFAYESISTSGCLDEASWTSIAGNYDDVNAGGDGTVDADVAGNLNGNGRVEERDFEIFKVIVGLGNEGDLINVPEPCGLLLILAGSTEFGFGKGIN